MHRTARRPGGAVTAALATTALVTSAVVGSMGAGSAEAAPPAPELEYAMDEIGEGTVADSSGNDHDGTFAGEVEEATGPDGSGALQLSGGHVELPGGVLGDSQDLTVQTEVRWDGGEDPWQWIFALGSDDEHYLFATPSNADGKLRTAATRSGGGSETQLTGHDALPAERWMTFTVVLDSAAQQLTTYIDGAAVSSVATDMTAQELVSASADSSGMIGASFYPDPPFQGAIDNFRIYRVALDDQQIAESQSGDVPALQELQQSTVEVATTVGEQPTLPDTLPGVFTDGIVRDIAVDWDDIDDEQLAQPGELAVHGTAGDDEVRADVLVRRGELRVDLSRSTGEVKGGASGLLYGLYGDGMPTSNLVEGMNVRTVATKAQDGAQHPGSDALEILPTLAEADGDVYLRVTDFYRGFPYEWPGDTPEEKLSDYRRVLDEQLDMLDELPEEQRAHVVIEPFNEPEGNMFGTGEWSLDGTSWLDGPEDFLAAWDETYRTIKERHPDVRVAGPGLSVLYDEMQDFLAHAVAEGTVPEIITWHELTHPQGIRDSVETFRDWEAEAFAGSEYEGTELPININEYAFNYHTSVPGQMIQWISAIEETKVDAMIAFWNINGNLSDSAVQANRGNGQWWLYNAYAAMTGDTVEVTAPSPGENYSLQGVASLDEETRAARILLGGADGSAPLDLANVPREVFGDSVRVQVREIAWTGQLGDSEGPLPLWDGVVPVDEDGTVTFDLGAGDLSPMEESSAYELIVTPGDGAEPRPAEPRWEASYEAEEASYEGSGHSKNGPEGSPDDVSKFYTSGGYDVGGLRTGSDGALTFEVEVPEDGTYDLSVFANSLNTEEAVEDQGPTNVFLSVDGEAEQELHLPLAYKWVVWDHTDTTVDLTAGTHQIRLAATSLDGSGTTQGDAIIDRITLNRSAPADRTRVYEAEHAVHDGTVTSEGTGEISLSEDETATFWVYGRADGEATLSILGSGTGAVTVNGEEVLDLDEAAAAAVHLEGGINKVVVSGEAVVDALEVGPGSEELAHTELQAEDAELSGDTQITERSLAEGGHAVEDIGGDPGNDSAVTFSVDAESAGRHAVVVRFSNPEQAPASHYNPNPMARNALISVNGGEPDSMLFVPTFHANNFWERTVYVDLEEGENTIRIGAEELTNFSGDGHIADIWPDYPWLRSDQGPILDRISVSPTHAPLPAGTSPGDEDPGDGAPGGDEPGEGTPSEEPAPAPGEDPADPGGWNRRV